MSESSPSRSRRRKLLRWLALTAVVAVVVPYVAGRALSGRRAVRIVTLPGVAEAAASTARRDTLRIATYNIAHGRGLASSNWGGGDKAARQARLDEIARLLRAEDLDLVVLNEVDFCSPWSHGVNQARALAAAAGYPYVVEQRNLDVRLLLWRHQIGNALLSRHPIRAAERVDLPGFARWETLLCGKKRGVVCTVAPAGGAPFRVFVTHLSHRSGTLRVASAERILALRDDPGLPLLCAGDLNSTWQVGGDAVASVAAPPTFAAVADPAPSTTANPAAADSAVANLVAADPRPTAVRRLLESGRFQTPEPAATRARLLTFPAAAPVERIDWILLPPAWKVLDYRALDTRLADHRPVVAEVATAVTPVDSAAKDRSAAESVNERAADEDANERAAP